MVNYDTHREYFQSGSQNPNELILLRYHKLNSEKTSQRNIACFYLYILQSVSRLKKKKKDKNILPSLILIGLEENHFYGRVFVDKFCFQEVMRGKLVANGFTGVTFRINACGKQWKKAERD